MSDKTPPKKPADAKDEAPRTITALGADRWQLLEHRNPGGWCCVPHGTTVEDLLAPAFWAHVARHLRPSTTLQVHWDDGTRFCELYVLAAGRNWASMSLLRDHELTKPHIPAKANSYDVSFNGPVDKFRVTRRPDNAVIQAGFDSELAARRWLEEYLRKLAA
jgi:hypothetical protein